MKEELKHFKINIEDIQQSYDLYSKLQKAIEEMQIAENIKNLEVVLNDNLLKVKSKRNGITTIFGLKVSFEQLEKDISFIVREENKEEEIDYKQKYFDLLNKISLLSEDIQND